VSVAGLSYSTCKELGECYIVICGLSESTIYFTLSHKKHHIWIQKIDCKMCASIFFTVLSETFLTAKMIHRDIVINLCRF